MFDNWEELNSELKIDRIIKEIGYRFNELIVYIEDLFIVNEDVDKVVFV